MQLDLSFADSVVFTTIMDNYIDALLGNTEMVKRAPSGIAQGDEEKRLLAEHGLSLLIEVQSGAKERTFLLDAGFTATGTVQNMQALNVDLARIERLVLSHGHVDHYGGLKDLLVQRPLPVVLHPHSFSEREVRRRDGSVMKMPRLDEKMVQQYAGEIVATAEPYPLAEGAWSTGQIERTTDFEKGISNAFRREDGDWEPDLLLDDQGIIINVKDKGLVVISGCAHAGIINTVRQAQKLTGIDKVYGLMGGFHLTGAGDEIVEKTLSELLALDPAVVVPMHCTGWKAMNAVSQALPDRFLLNSVGTQITF